MESDVLLSCLFELFRLASLSNPILSRSIIASLNGKIVVCIDIHSPNYLLFFLFSYFISWRWIEAGTHVKYPLRRNGKVTSYRRSEGLFLWLKKIISLTVLRICCVGPRRSNLWDKLLVFVYDCMYKYLYIYICIYVRVYMYICTYTWLSFSSRLDILPLKFHCE